MASVSLPTVAKAIGVDNNGAHDALFDCEYLMKVLQKTLDLVRKHPTLDYKEYLRPRLLRDTKYNVRRKKKSRF